MNIDYGLEAASDKLSKLKAGALFMRMGARKTKMALDLIKNKQDDFDTVVWIAPASFLGWDGYTKAIDENLEGLTKEICFFSIESISCSDIRYLQLYALAERYRVFCVVDESITIKNTEAGRTKRLLLMRNMFDYRLILSSLPLTQGLVDLYSQIEFMHPSVLNMSETQFLNTYLSPYDDGTTRKWSKPENEKILIEQMRPFIFQCDLDEHNNLNYIDLCFDLTEKEEASYQEEKNEFLQGKNQVAFMEVAQRFQHIYTIAKNKVEGLFAQRINIMFSTYGVDSQGLDLCNCNNIIYFSQTFDYKSKLQCMHNVYQSHTGRSINIYNLWINTGLDKLIKQNLSRKKNVLSNVCRMISREEALAL